MKLEDFKNLLGDRYKFTADYDLDEVRKAINENKREFAGETPFVLEAGCVDIEVEIWDDEGRVYGDYNICVKTNEYNWRTFDSLPEEVDFDVPDMEDEMFRLLDKYVTENNLSYTQYNDQQVNGRVRGFVKPPNEQKQDRATTLADLVKCGLADVHLLHCDEEIELATVAELNANTLTEQGKADWEDVLNATVKGIYEGGYGIQIDLADVEPERLSDFSLMLAGSCPAKDYDKWIADESGQSQEQGMNM